VTGTGEDVSYGRRLTEIATDRPDESKLTIANRDGTETQVTWRTLETRANQIARELEAKGVVQDSIVALVLPTCVDHILVTLAIWKLGATLLPARYDVPQWELDRLVSLADPAVVVSDTHTADGRPVLTRADLDATSALDGGPLEDRIPDCLNLLASSGSTGNPKLIVSPMRGVVADDPIPLYDTNEEIRILVCSPLYHVNGFNYAAPQLLEGNTVVVMEKFDAQQAVDLIEKHRLTFTVMVPTMLQRVARLDVRPEQLASLERVIYGGAKVPEWVVDRWLDLIPPKVFTFVYGSSERLGSTMMSGEEWADHRGATGRPFDATLSIRNDELEEVPLGEVGHIYMKPLDPNRRMFQYIGIPTPDPTPDGYYTIGDLGWVDADGYLYVADRRKDMIITGGANVFPAEVETALSEHPGVIDQVVVPVPDDEWGHRVHAIIQPADPANPPSADELRAFCKERLVSYKAPKTYEFVERVPRTEAGKLNRTALGEERASTTAS
jgi:bile acid-coenzyme A ligase